MADTPVRYLALSDVAARIGVTLGTIQSYSGKGMLPTPDILVGSGPRAVRGWLPSTIDTWNANRPGPGRWGRRQED